MELNALKHPLKKATAMQKTISTLDRQAIQQLMKTLIASQYLCLSLITAL